MHHLFRYRNQEATKVVELEPSEWSTDNRFIINNNARAAVQAAASKNWCLAAGSCKIAGSVTLLLIELLAVQAQLEQSAANCAT